MLKIGFGELGLKLPGRISHVSQYFDDTYENEWLNAPMAEEIVREVDLTEHIKDGVYESKTLGTISARELSAGSKGLILLLNENVPVRGEVFGDNCAEWLLKIGKIKDITISLHHVLKFKEPFEIYSLNSNKLIMSYKDYLNELVNTI